MKRPNYSASIPSITWSEFPSSWGGEGAIGTFDDFSDIRFAYQIGGKTSRLKIAYAKHTLDLKDSIKASIGELLPWTTTCINYGDAGASQSTGIHYDIDTTQDLTDAFQAMYDAIGESYGTKVNVGNGIKFDDTLMAGFSEREYMSAMTYCQMMHGTELPGVGTNVRAELTLSELAKRKARPDAVEYDDDGNVITIIECQSGIKDGACLDNDHFARIISEYPYHPDFNGTVRKLVVIAGEYMPWHVKALQAAPFEVVILQTAIQNNRVVLQPYAESL
jgi:hypothetical protein